MFKKIILFLNQNIKKLLSDENLTSIQRKLIGAGIFIQTETIISILLIMMIITFIISFLLLLIMGLPIVLSVIFSLAVPLSFFSYVYYKNEKRLESMDLDLPDYLRQLAALIKVGYGLESAFNELSKTMNNSLNDEIKRALLETSFGKPFNEALMDVAVKNNSENMKHTFQIIIYSKESGGNIVDVLEDIADDLTDIIVLKKERRANVMMSVMFLIISSTIATPFALGMIRLYSNFLGQLGRSNPLESVIPTASMGYVIIQSVLVSLLIGIVLYSDSKKGIKYILVIVPLSLSVYFISQLLFEQILGVSL